TNDGAKTWVEVAAIPGAESLEIDPLTPSTVYAGTRKRGVYKTDDSGHHWDQYSTGLHARGGVTSVAVDPAKPSVVYAGVFGRGVFRTFDAGGHWQEFNRGLDDRRVSGLVVSPDGTQLHAATAGGGVFNR